MMWFRAGDSRYRVRIVEGPLFGEVGGEVADLTFWDKREIHISSTVSPQQRWPVLLHALGHVWDAEFGRPKDTDEDRANRTASFTADVMNQFASQGGHAALQRLNTDGIVDHDEPAVDEAGELVAAEPSNAECGRCGGTFSIQQIVDGPPEPNPNDGGKVMVRRSLWCDHCTHVQEWLEGATKSGQPTGKVLCKPRYLRGAAAARFLRKHGEAAGVCA